MILPLLKKITLSKNWQPLSIITLPSVAMTAVPYTVKFLLTSVVGNNNVLCTYKGQNDVADVTVLYGDTLANLGKAIPHAKYSDDYVFDRWIYVDNKGNQHTITSTTIFNEEIFMGSAVTVIAQCKPSPYGPTIS